MRHIRFLFLAAASALFAGGALANPVVCSPGYMDSTCVTPISKAPQPAPACSTGAGWTTVSPARWLGSGWSQPTCSYTPPPTCPSGYNETTSPTWNGSSWVGLGCTAASPWFNQTYSIGFCDTSNAADTAWTCSANTVSISFDGSGTPHFNSPNGVVYPSSSGTTGIYAFGSTGFNSNGINLYCWGLSADGFCGISDTGGASVGAQQTSLDTNASGLPTVLVNSNGAYSSPSVYIPYADFINGDVTVWTAAYFGVAPGGGGG